MRDFSWSFQAPPISRIPAEVATGSNVGFRAPFVHTSFARGRIVAEEVIFESREICSSQSSTPEAHAMCSCDHSFFSRVKIAGGPIGMDVCRRIFYGHNWQQKNQTRANNPAPSSVNHAVITGVLGVLSD